jgi:uncharacterized membrane protein
MIVRDAVIIEAPVERVWEVFTDVDRWPEWTPSVTSAAVIAGDGVALGARVRIKQPRLPEMTWEVTRVEPGSTWTWVSRSPGAVTEAVHHVRALDDSTTRVEQIIEQTGIVGAVVGRLLRGMTRRYLAMEGAGLKHRCQAGGSGAAAA